MWRRVGTRWDRRVVGGRSMDTMDIEETYDLGVGGGGPGWTLRVRTVVGDVDFPVVVVPSLLYPLFPPVQ